MVNTGDLEQFSRTSQALKTFDAVFPRLNLVKVGRDP